MAFSPDGRLLATAGEDGTARLWNPATGQHLRTLGGRRRRTLDGHTGAVWGVAFSPDGRWLASGSDDKTVRLWDPATGQHMRMRTPGGHAGAVWGGVQPGRAAARHRRRRQDGAAVEPGHRRAPSHPHRPRRRGRGGVAFSPDGRLLATASEDKTARLWD